MSIRCVQTRHTLSTSSLWPSLWPSSTLRTKAHSVKSSGAMLAAAIASARPRASAHMPALAQALIAVLYVTKLGTT